ncbi:tetratricopeptide repeat protein [Bremerella alba]|uniref:Beta-barrel assembly-enhancing protease n=1 Tax=Bremerella alba TaxID=980252 RepID=A0A7V8V1G2_9BACT|nr:tetratricopeptide repeat protein [Bremerella alba]MBA2113202.1 Beta-barrel assembly-enhancing protease [Bremerella alba]
MTHSALKLPISLLPIGTLVLLPVASSTLHACIDGIESAGSAQVAFLPNRRGLEMPQIDRPEMRRARIKAKIVDLTKKISNEGKTAERFAERGELHVQLDQIHWAVVDYDDAIKLEPKSFALRDRRLVLNRELENFDQVEEDLTALIEIDKSAIRFLERGKFFVEQRNNEKAIEDFTSAIEFDPNLADAYLQRGQLIKDKPSQIKELYGIDQRNLEEAVVDFAKAIELKPDLIEPRRTLIIAYMNLQRYSDAVDQATAIIERIPDDECAKYYRAKSYKHQKKYDLALADLNDLIERVPTASKFIELRAEIYRDTNQVDKAIEDYQHNIEIDGDNHATHTLFARYLLSNKKYALAIKPYSDAIELNQHDQRLQAQLFRERGNAHYWLGELEECEKDLEQAIKLSKNPSFYMRERARVLVRLERPDEAIAIYENMIENYPDNKGSYMDRARLYIVNKQYDKALEDVNTFISQIKNYEESYLLRAQIWARMGNEDGVQEDLKRAKEAKEHWAEVKRKAESRM